jgi:hypothetical protein
MGDYSQLSMFSPIQQKRMLSPTQTAPVYWAASASRAKRPSSGNGDGLKPDGQDIPPGFKRTKVKMAGSTLATSSLGQGTALRKRDAHE